MAAPAAISGATFVSEGYTTQLSDATAGGTWSSSDESIATVSASGIVTGVSVGSVTISYSNGDGTATLDMEVNPVRITNGFNLDRIFPAFRERIGWHQPSMPNMPTLSTANKKALSGTYYDRGIHGSVTVQNVYLNQENATTSDNEFNDYLTELDDSCTVRCLTSVFNSPTLIEHKPNYVRTANLLNANLPNQDLMVGYRINVAAGNYAGVINSISLFFTEVATFNIYLYNDLLLPPVKTKQVTTVAKSQTRVQLDWVMNYLTSSNNGGNTNGNIGGVWYLCYRQSEVAASNPNCVAINEQLNLWTDTKVVGAFPFQSPENDVYAFVRTNPAINFVSYGINIEFSSYKDYTQMIIQNAHLFDEVRRLCMAVIVMEMLQNSTRSNGIERQVDNNISRFEYDLNLAFPTKEFPFMAGIKQRIERELKSLNDRFNPPAQAMSISIGQTDWWGDRYYQGMDIAELPPRDFPSVYNP